MKFKTFIFISILFVSFGNVFSVGTQAIEIHKPQTPSFKKDQAFAKKYMRKQLKTLFQGTKIPKNPSTSEVIRQYQVQSLAKHPDKHPGQKDKYTKIFQELNNAKQFLLADKEQQIQQIIYAYESAWQKEIPDKNLQHLAIYTIITVITTYNAIRYIMNKLELKQDDIDTIMQLDISDKEMETLVKLRSSLRHTYLPKWLKKQLGMQIDWALAQVSETLQLEL